MIYENSPAIQTKRLILRKFIENDTEAYLKIMSDEEANTFLPWFPLKTLAEAKESLYQNYLRYYSRQSAYRYAVCRKEDNTPVGYVVLNERESHDFGYGLRTEFWHQGIISEAAAAVVAQIKNAGYPFITATHDVKNPRSGAVLQKLGMRYEYSYVELWQPKNYLVTFRMYQLNFDEKDTRTYMEYWNQSENHFIEQIR